MQAPVASFIWVHTFKLQVYGPLVLPLLAVFILCACEAVGDVTATCDVSRLEVEGKVFNSRIQGCMLSDGLGCIFAALGTMTPMTTFAQNNGVIALTRCANRAAGFCCWYELFSLCPCSSKTALIVAIKRFADLFLSFFLFFLSLFLIIAGIFAKFAAAIVAIPDPVMGGMTTFLFSSVLVSGLAIVAKIPFNRRNRFILTASLALG